MESTIVGRLLYNARKGKNISQKKLCHGICNQSTLTRIEKGEIRPELKLVETFFTRLGYSVPNNIIMISKAEIKRKDIEDKLLLLSDNKDNKKLELLDEYKKCHASWGKLNEQFYLFQQGIHLRQSIKTIKTSIAVFEKALKLTVPEFCVEKEMPDSLFSITEIGIINSIAHSEYYLYDIEKTDIELKNRAIQRMRFLKNYFEDNFNNYKNWTMYSIILFNLTNWVGLDGHFDEARELSQTGMKIEHISVTYLILHLYNYGYTLASLGKKKEAESYFNRFLKLYPLIDVYNDINETMDELNEKFGFNFSK